MKSICLLISALALSGPTMAAPTDCIYGKESAPVQANVLDSWNTSVADHKKKVEELIQRERSNYAQCLELWVGKSINEFAAAMGAPTQTSKMPNGEVIYVWQEQAGERMCRTSMFTKRSKISKWQAFGNSCRREAPPSLS